MLINTIHSVTSWFLKKRIRQIEHFIQEPYLVQKNILLNLTGCGATTKYGQKYNFSSIKDYSDFSKQVPCVTYEDIEPLIERSRKGENNIFWNSPIKWFAKSSGTTNAKSKFIPVSHQALHQCHYKAGKDMLSLYLNNNENSALFTGKSLRLGGSKQIYKQNGTFFGDLSAILIDNLPLWAQYNCTPNNKISLMSEWEKKLKSIVNQSVKENVTSLVGVPSWMLVLLNDVLDATGKENLLQVWENLEVYFHGGINFIPYKEQYRKLIPSSQFKYYETYNASEGFFAIQDQNHSNEMLLMLDYGIFYEFIPMDTFGGENQKIIPLWQVEKDKNYALVITTNSGLWRYIIGDTIRFTSLNPYRIQITGRTKHFINVFGEELIVENAEKALEKACKATQSNIKEYTVAPIFMNGKEKGGHQWLIEFEKSPSDIEKFNDVLDASLQNLNSDYEAKRYNNMTLNRPTISIAKNGLFNLWLKNKNKLGGQHKIPRMFNNRDFMEELLQLNHEM